MWHGGSPAGQLQQAPGEGLVQAMRSVPALYFQEHFSLSRHAAFEPLTFCAKLLGLLASEAGVWWHLDRVHRGVAGQRRGMRSRRARSGARPARTVPGARAHSLGHCRHAVFAELGAASEPAGTQHAGRASGYAMDHQNMILVVFRSGLFCTLLCCPGQGPSRWVSIHPRRTWYSVPAASCNAP